MKNEEFSEKKIVKAKKLNTYGYRECLEYRYIRHQFLGNVEWLAELLKDLGPGKIDIGVLFINDVKEAAKLVDLETIKTFNGSYRLVTHKSKIEIPTDFTFDTSLLDI